MSEVKAESQRKYKLVYNQWRTRAGPELCTFLADLAGEHVVAFARPPAHPGLVEDAFLPGFDELQQVQV